MSDAVEQKLNDLESQLAFVDDAVEKLNQAVIDQQNTIEKLERSLVNLSHQIKLMTDDKNKPIERHIPPHY